MMGIWRRAQIVGTCDAGEVSALREKLKYNRNTLSGFHCLCGGGMAGLPNWAAEKINAVGNLAERGYDADSVAETLEELAKAAPSLAVDVHLGDEGEVDECSDTIRLSNGKAEIMPPQIKTLPEIPQDRMKRSMMAQMLGGGDSFR